MKKRIIALMLTGAMTAGLLAGCGGNGGGSSTGGSDSSDKSGGDSKEVVDVNFYVPIGTINDQERIMEKVNEVTEKEIGVHLNLNSTATDYQAIQLMIDTGDDWDMAFTSNWLGDYFGNAQDGAYADLTELLPKLAPETYSSIPESLWDGMKVDGKIYGIVNYQLFGSASKPGLRFRKDIAEEVGFDWQSLKGMDIFDALNKIETEFLAPAKKAHPDMIGWEAQAGSNMYGQAKGAQFLNCEYVGDSVEGSVGWINYDDPTKVFNQYATDDFMEYCKIMRRWYEAGYIPADAATVTDTSADRQSARYLCEFALGWPDSIDFPMDRAMSMTNVDTAPAVEVSLTDLVMPAAAGPTAAVAINSQSKNVEKCLELMELLNTNDDLYKLLCYGEEGVDYDYDENGNVTYTDGGYFINYSDYMIGQSYDADGDFSRTPLPQNETGEQSKEMYKMVYDGDKEAMASPLSGFVFDSSSVQTEIANVTSVVTEMLKPLVTGSVDPETTVPQFLERLKTAGVDKIIAEKQAQLDAWNASK